jgi:4-hydroxybenzoate polyprenyltransferase
VYNAEVLSTTDARLVNSTFTLGVRARDWAHFLVLPLASADSLAGGVRGVALALLVLAFGYLLNGIADRELDRDAVKNPFVERDGRHALMICALLPALSLALACTGPRQVVIAVLVCIASGTVYSVGPRLKRVPLLGTLLNLTNFLPLLWFGGGAQASPRDSWILAAVFAGLLLQNQLIHEAADADDDEPSGVRTTFIAAGPRWSAVGLLLLGGAVAATILRGASLLALGLGAGALFGAAFPCALAVAGDRRPLLARVRFWHRWCCVATGATLFLCLHW